MEESLREARPCNTASCSHVQVVPGLCRDWPCALVFFVSIRAIASFSASVDALRLHKLMYNYVCYNVSLLYVRMCACMFACMHARMYV